MIEVALGIAKEELNNISVPYDFMRAVSAVDGRYWVGEYLESPTGTEDGYEEGTLILTGTSKTSWWVLMQDRTRIKDHFSSISGLRKSTDKGAVVIFYEDSIPVPTQDANLKRIQVNLRIKMWKGMN